MSSGKLRAYLELARPANVVTAWADICAGVAASGLFSAFWAPWVVSNGSVGEMHESPLAVPLFWLLLATSGLYAGGVVLNDVFDAELDATERPERAIPSGRASKVGASIFGVLLLGLGMAAAFQVNMISGWIAVGVGLLAVIYDRFGKHFTLLGPLNMGLCRSGNLMLGVSAVPAALFEVWFLAFIPLVYIGAITAISQGEVYGGSSTKGRVAVIFVLSVVSSLVLLVFSPGYNLLYAGVFILLFAWAVIPSFLRAAQYPEALNIRRAVKAGIMGLIPLNAALAAGFAGWPLGIIVLLFLPISIGLARFFAVT
ncbi:MAG: UbiA-like protein EboC [Rhodothermales bacterium]